MNEKPTEEKEIEREESRGKSYAARVVEEHRQEREESEGHHHEEGDKGDARRVHLRHAIVECDSHSQKILPSSTSQTVTL